MVVVEDLVVDELDVIDDVVDMVDWEEVVIWLLELLPVVAADVDVELLPEELEIVDDDEVGPDEVFDMVEVEPLLEDTIDDPEALCEPEVEPPPEELGLVDDDPVEPDVYEDEPLLVAVSVEEPTVVPWEADMELLLVDVNELLVVCELVVELLLKELVTIDVELVELGVEIDVVELEPLLEDSRLVVVLCDADIELLLEMAEDVLVDVEDVAVVLESDKAGHFLEAIFRLIRAESSFCLEAGAVPSTSAETSRQSPVLKL